eukprot:TRINITY_DN6489_c0_g1_i4.p1 TRINITY_DN6489_c0_g1~~TRINITY_DN6489_c0_g1_i4.p1  ORF type:complete len:198 (-),score=13.31 TRINITY_DN6489_c0_g1_i4:79-672(-)
MDHFEQRLLAPRKPRPHSASTQRLLARWSANPSSTGTAPAPNPRPASARSRTSSSVVKSPGGSFVQSKIDIAISELHSRDIRRAESYNQQRTLFQSQQRVGDQPSEPRAVRASRPLSQPVSQGVSQTRGRSAGTHRSSLHSQADPPKSRRPKSCTVRLRTNQTPSRPNPPPWGQRQEGEGVRAVSYTHLTLPTKRIV